MSDKWKMETKFVEGSKPGSHTLLIFAKDCSDEGKILAEYRCEDICWGAIKRFGREFFIKGEKKTAYEDFLRQGLSSRFFDGC